MKRILKKTIPFRHLRKCSSEYFMIILSYLLNPNEYLIIFIIFFRLHRKTASENLLVEYKNQHLFINNKEKKISILN
jgi:hypothetical protein